MQIARDNAPASIGLKDFEAYIRAPVAAVGRHRAVAGLSGSAIRQFNPRH
jgi:hypothetical protein